MLFGELTQRGQPTAGRRCLEWADCLERDLKVVAVGVGQWTDKSKDWPTWKKFHESLSSLTPKRRKRKLI